MRKELPLLWGCSRAFFFLHFPFPWTVIMSVAEKIFSGMGTYSDWALGVKICTGLSDHRMHLSSTGCIDSQLGPQAICSVAFTGVLFVCSLAIKAAKIILICSNTWKF